MYVWDDGTVTGSVDTERLIAEYPDHPETLRILAEREAAQGSGPDSEEDLEAETVESLKEQLRERDLPVSGNKAELIERLREADEPVDEPSDSEESDADGED